MSQGHRPNVAVDRRILPPSTRGVGFRYDVEVKKTETVMTGATTTTAVRHLKQIFSCFSVSRSGGG